MTGWGGGVQASVDRRGVVRAVVGAATTLIGVASHLIGPPEATAHHHHKRHRKRCRTHCKNNRKTCDRGCDILDGDSQTFCKQGCKVALAQCRSEC